MDLSKNFWNMTSKERQHYEALTGKKANTKPLSYRETAVEEKKTQDFDGYFPLWGITGKRVFTNKQRSPRENCLICGTILQGKKRIFCSKECNAAERRT